MHLLLLAMTLVAFGGKKNKKNAEAPTPESAVEEAAVEEPAAEPAPPVEPPAPAPPAKNADFTVTIGQTGGGTTAGHVYRVERADDIYGDKGWTDDAKKLLFYIEGNNEYKKIAWSDVKRISIQVKDAKDQSCVYSSDFSPWMYECSVKLTSSLTTKDGKTYAADSGHKWRFFLDGDKEVEFWLKRHYAREQDEEVVGLDHGNPENYELYGKLQQQLKDEVKSGLINSITVK
jgi:hypothetical protein